MENSPSILIVDDDMSMANSVAAVLSASGYSDISILDNAAAAVAQLSTNQFNLALVDVRMPLMSGFELLDAIDRDEIHTVFIIMTGDTSIDTAVSALRHGAADYIRKPYEPDELLARIEKALQQQQLQDSNRLIKAEKKSLERQLWQSQKLEAVGSLAGGVAHDFNNILSIILGNTEMARSEVSSDHPIRENLDRIKLASARAKVLIDQLLTFSRKSDMGLETLEFNSVIAECLTLMRASLPSNIIISHEIADTTFYIQGNATQIDQIVINLCTNAAQAMEPDGGVIEIKIELSEQEPDDVLSPHTSQVMLSVIDTGPGIDPLIMGRIFDPYFTTKDQGGGSGLGLAVVHGIVKNHDGDISVISHDSGTEFQIRLPLSDLAARKAEIIVEDSLEMGSERILLVDDEEMLLDVISQMLNHLGYQVHPFVDSRKALASFQKAPDSFDLVITDLTMPDMTGDDLAEHITRIRSDIPVILLSGYSVNLDQSDLQSKGVHKVISKPVTLEDLAKAIRIVLDASMIERRLDRRVEPGDDSFVVFASSPAKRSSLIDLSVSGLALKGAYGQDQPIAMNLLSIVSDDYGLSVDDLYYETVWETMIDASTQCRGLKFSALTSTQLRQLGSFIESHPSKGT